MAAFSIDLSSRLILHACPGWTSLLGMSWTRSGILGPVTSLGYSASAADRNGEPLIVSSGTGLANVGILTSIPDSLGWTQADLPVRAV